MRRLFALSLLCFSASVFAAPVAKPVSWEEGGTNFDGQLVYDDASDAKRPGLLMVPNWYGVNEHSIEKAKTLAGSDYVILLVDMYGRGLRPANPQEAGQAAGAVYADPVALRARINKALTVLQGSADKAPLDTGNIGGIGFCFGGAMVLELARSGADIKGVASFHGNLGTRQPATPDSVKAAVLVMNGADDTFVSAEQIAGFQKEMTDAKADWQFVNYSGAVHCFAEPDEDGSVIGGCKYHEPSYRRSVALMRSFFAERFAQ
ncbi:MAG TPA: dienelactone hydrolase family protein [Arenimonas sp.]|nr:dienelactone hydrolase family protein [Arenimonas sp.]